MLTLQMCLTLQCMLPCGGTAEQRFPAAVSHMYNLRYSTFRMPPLFSSVQSGLPSGCRAERGTAETEWHGTDAVAL
jgi:hypothetical protein